MKNTFNIILLSAVAGLTTLGSCNRNGLGCIRASGPVITDTRTVKDFTDVEVQSSATVYISEDSAYSFNANGPQTLIENLIVSVRGGKLIIKDRRCVRGSSQLVINIHMPQVGNIKLAGSANISVQKSVDGPQTVRYDITGSGNIKVLGELNVTDLFCTITGSGDIEVPVNTVHSSMNINGSGKITTYGTAGDCDITINGSGKIHNEDLNVTDQYVHITGSGDAWVRADKNLDIDISGSGTVHYYGWPHVSSRISGSGKIVHEN